MQARQAIPTDPAIWITAAKLEESQGHADTVRKVIARALKSLQANGVIIDRETWLREAENAEQSTPPMILTCRALVEEVVDMGVDPVDRERTWCAFGPPGLSCLFQMPLGVCSNGPEHGPACVSETYIHTQTFKAVYIGEERHGRT